MIQITRFLLLALMLVPYGAWAAPLSGTMGSNLTAYNPGSGSRNNNEWNSLMNGRSSGAASAPAADFGNCNSLILRCASPKCANGGCATMEIASPIVAGCVSANDACKQYGDDLINAIAAQLVASSTAKTNAQMAAAQSAAAAQNAQQMQQMQAQMQQMQQQMAAQNAEQIQQLQSALEEQKQITAQAIADASAAQSAQSAGVSSGAANSSATGMQNVDMGSAPTTVLEGLTESQRIAANAGVPADVLAREQVAGQILTSLENASKNLATARAAMQEAFRYAGCDTSGNNCVGPKRVSVFKQKAMEFFDPYDAVLDELYDALITAQSVGVDITDIYMMLNGSCNVWGEYLCYGGTKVEERDGIDANGRVTKVAYTSWATYNKDNCVGGKSLATEFSKGGVDCQQGAVIPPEDSPACTLNRTLTDMEDVQRNFLFSDAGYADEHVRIGCASSALESSKLFRGRKKQATIDIETLQRIIAQDAPAVMGSNRYRSTSGNNAADVLKYCALTPKGYSELEKAVATKKLPSRICVKDASLATTWQSGGQITASGFDMYGISGAGSSNPDYKDKNVCENVAHCRWSNNQCVLPDGYKWEEGYCVSGATSVNPWVATSGKYLSASSYSPTNYYNACSSTCASRGGECKSSMGQYGCYCGVTILPDSKKCIAGGIIQ